jgi:hypothetical protein
MFVLEALDPGDYAAFGEALRAEPESRLFHFDALYKVESSALRFSASGSHRLLNQMKRHEFHLTIRPTSDIDVAFEYRDKWLPEVGGTGAWFKDGYLLSGECTRTGAIFASFVTPNGKQALEVRSTVKFPQRPTLAIHFSIRSREPLDTLENVVSLSRRRSAA